MAKITVFVMYGFLDSGKTSFINHTLKQDYFKIKEKTLYIQCEEGVEEVEEKILEDSNTVKEVIDTEGNLTQANLLLLQEKHNAQRVIIEYNGSWNVHSLIIPTEWEMLQELTLIDASTFDSYLKNMRSMIMDPVRKSELVIFNRCDGYTKIGEYKRTIYAINKQAEIIFEDEIGEIQETLEEELPYDMEADVISLDNQGYGLWHFDIIEHMDRYIGKQVEFIGKVLKPVKFPRDFFVPGRTVMTCCKDDMSFLGFACQWDKAETLEEQEWIKIVAEIRYEYWPDYEGKGPVLYAVSIEKANEPEDPIIFFI